MVAEITTQHKNSNDCQDKRDLHLDSECLEAGADWARFRQNSEISGGQSEEREPVHQTKPLCEPISLKALWAWIKFPFALCCPDTTLDKPPEPR
jgi:hypothetical protein